MISPESLRRYPFFGGLTQAQLASIAMIATQETYPAGATVFEKGMPADTLFFLEEGSIDLYYPAKGKDPSKFPQGILVSEINPGEPFSISALIEPYVIISTARAAKTSRVIKIEAKALRARFKNDRHMAYLLTQQAARVVSERLDATRVQLAAAWA